MSIDWSVFDKYSEDTVTCRCETVYRSHAKFVLTPEPHIETRKPCPGCGRTDNSRRVSSDPEVVTLRGDDIEKS